MSDTADLQVIEWHDGTLFSVEISQEHVVLNFERAYVYRRHTAERFAIERCGARLILSNVSSFRVEGSFAADACVTDCDIDSPTSSDDVQRLLHGVDATTIRVTLTNGTKLEARCTAARLDLTGVFEHVRMWEGPL